MASKIGKLLLALNITSYNPLWASKQDCNLTEIFLSSVFWDDLVAVTLCWSSASESGYSNSYSNGIIIQQLVPVQSPNDWPVVQEHCQWCEFFSESFTQLICSKMLIHLEIEIKWPSNESLNHSQLIKKKKKLLHSETNLLGVFDLMQCCTVRSVSDLKQCVLVKKVFLLKRVLTPHDCEVLHQSTRTFREQMADSAVAASPE